MSLAHASPTGKNNAPERLAYCTIALEEFGCAAVGRWVGGHVVRRKDEPAAPRGVVVHQCADELGVDPRPPVDKACFKQVQVGAALVRRLSSAPAADEGISQRRLY